MGKRKHDALDTGGGDGNQDKDKDHRTVFVRGLSFAAGEADLEAQFSEVGPVRKCFIVRTKGADKHKGFGFVQFALPEDAERAMQQLQGRDIQGRKVHLELATRRAALDTRYPKALSEAKHKKDREGGEGTNQEDRGNEAAAAAPAAAAPVKAPAAAAPAPTKAERPQRPQRGKAAQNGAATGQGQTQGQGQQQQRKARAPGAPDTHWRDRTVAIGGLPQGDRAAVEAVLSLARSVGPVERVEDPVPAIEADKAKLAADGCRGHVVMAVYENPRDAALAVRKLHARTLAALTAPSDAGAAALPTKKGKKASTVDAAAASSPILWARQVGGEGSHVKRWRLIVRNLPFGVTEASLREALGAAGFVWEASLPRTPEGKTRGFGFVAFTTRAEAERAIKDVNGRPIGGRVVAVDWAVAKNEFEAAAKTGDAAAAAKPGKEEEEESEEESRSEGEEEEEEEEGSEGDMFESDDDDEEGDYEGESGEEEEEEGAKAKDGNVKSEVSMMKRLAAEMAAKAAAQDKAAEAKEKGKETEKEKDKDKPAKEKKEKKPPAQGPDAAPADFEGRRATAEPASTSKAQARPKDGAVLPSTVFIRNLPLDVTGLSLRLRLEALFGPVKSCRIVMDKATGKPRGTAFVDFATEEAAKKAGAASALAKRGKGPAIDVGGSHITVDLALSKDGARDLAAGRAAELVQSKDRRNLYLAEEGKIEQGTPAWEAMSEGDRQKRDRARRDMKLKLASPNFVVSRTRLSVRNVPFTWNEAQLKKLFMEAVIRRSSRAKPMVKQVKLLRETEGGKKDKDGNPRSKGLGFVEFEDHEHALCALRELNNNPNIFGLERRPIVEFALENSKILKARDDREKIRQSHGGRRKRDEDEDGEEKARPKKKSRIERRQERKARERAAKAAAEAEGAGPEAVAAAVAAASAAPGSGAANGAGKGGKGKAGAPGAAGKRGFQAEKGLGRAAREPREPREGPQGRGKREGAHGGKRERVEAQVASEERESKRRRAADEAIDRLAAQGAASAAPTDAAAKKSRGRATRREEKKGKSDKGDKLDQLASEYVTKLFGGAAGGAGAASAAKGGKGKGAAASRSGSEGVAKKGKPAARAAALAKGKASVASLDFGGGGSGGIKRWFE